MSHSSTSVGSNLRRNGQVLGIPKSCSCDRGVTLRVSKSEGNPNRRYYRCDLAFERKLNNDAHLFKWLDDALLEEAVILSRKNEDLRKDIADMWMLLKDYGDRLEDIAMEVKKETKKMKLMMCLVVIVPVSLFVMSKKMF